MSLVRNLFFLFTVTIFGIASTILNIFNYNPYSANTSELINFYISLFVGIGGVTAIVIIYLKSKMIKKANLSIAFWPSIRQGSLVSLGITSTLLLRGLRILDWLIGVSILVVVALLELFFQTKRTTN